MSFPVVLASQMQTALLGGGAAAFTPQSLSSLQLWLDSSVAASLYQDAALTTPATANNDLVAGAKDQGALLKHATQATDTKRPTLKTASQNGKSTLFHSTVTCGLATASITHGIGTGNFYVAAVIKTPAAGASYRCIWGQAAGPAPGLYVLNSALNLYWVTDHVFAAPLTAATWYLVELMRVGSTVSTWVNGALDVNTFTISTSMASGAQFWGCSSALAGEGLNGSTAELVFSASAPSATQQLQAQSYFNTKWGLGF